MNTNVPAYLPSQLGDEQWDKYIASEERIRLQEIEARKEVDLEKLREERSQRKSRQQLVGSVLGALGFLLAILGFFGFLYFGITKADQRDHEIARTCVQAGGRWIDDDSGKVRCEPV